MSYLTLKEIYNRYPLTKKYNLSEVLAVCEKIRKKNSLSDNDRKALRLYNEVERRDELLHRKVSDLEEQAVKNGELATGNRLYDLLEKNEDWFIRQEHGAWVIYEELVEHLKKSGYLELLKEQSEKDIQEYIMYGDGWKPGNTTHRIALTKFKSKMHVRKQMSATDNIVRNINNIARKANRRFR